MDKEVLYDDTAILTIHELFFMRGKGLGNHCVFSISYELQGALDTLSGSLAR